MNKAHKNNEHLALDMAVKGMLISSFEFTFGTREIVDALVNKDYVHTTKDRRVMLNVEGARALLDYEGIEWRGKT
jgi:hypothetical protein